MLRYDSFFREFVARRIDDFNKTHNTESLVELPTGSVLHTYDCFNRPYIEIGPTPIEANVLHQLDPQKKALVIQKQWNNNPKSNFHAPEKGMKLLTVGVASLVSKYKTKMGGRVKLYDKLEDLVAKPNIQSIVNYNPLGNLRLTGKLQTLRSQNITLSTILNNIEEMDNREHFIHIPASNATFTRSDFIRSFKEHSKEALKYPELPYYVFLAHLLSFMVSDSDSSFMNKLSDRLHDKVHFIISKGDKFVIYRLDQLRDMNGDGDTILNKVISQLNSLVGSGEVSEEVSKDLVAVSNNVEEMNVTSFSGDITPEEIAKFNNSLIEDNLARGHEKIDADPKLSPAQKERLKKISTKYKDLTFNGKSLESILSNTTNTNLGSNHLDFLEDQIDDKSLLNSSISNFSTDYMNNSFEKDLINNMLSFSAQGMFMVDFKVEDKSDRYNKISEYTVKFEGVDGKKHTIKFTLPNVDKDGNCFVGGAIKGMKLQRVNLPIVKVSDTRISLNSNLNKTLVERRTTNANSFITYFKRILAKAKGLTVKATKADNPKLKLPYEYFEISKAFTAINCNAFNWTFKYEERFNKVQQSTKDLESKYGVYLGSSKDSLYFIDIRCNLSVVAKSTGNITRVTTLVDEIFKSVEVEGNVPSLNEWVDLKVLQKKLPLVFVLCYRFGLSHILSYLNVKYEEYGPNERIETDPTDVIIKFKNRKLVIKRSPILHSLIFSGLNFYKLGEYDIEDLDEKDVYYELIQSKKLSINYLKGIDDIFEMFIDPLTADTLHQMGEPTNMKDLFIRSVVLLTTPDSNVAAASANFKFRSYERFNAIVYNKLARALHKYKHGGAGASNKFSISPFEVMGTIMTDPLMNNIDTVNPITDIKNTCGYSHIGEGGRSSDAFVIDDRQFTEDSIGIVSEATVDSGKAAIDASLSVDPTIVNTRGMSVSKDVDELGPANMLSPTGLLFPGATNDDGKRANFINIQMAHYVPCSGYSPARIRTGFERVMAHRTRMPFAYPAEEDGTVLDINEQLNMITVKYKQKDKQAAPEDSIYTLKYGHEIVKNGGGGFYIDQRIALNNIKKGSKFKRGDILLYNEDFFTNDPISKQVDMNLGAHVNVALVESSTTQDDGSLITRKLGNLLNSSPVQKKSITINTRTNIHSIATVGTNVISTDSLMVFDEGEVPGSFSGEVDSEMLDIIKGLNRATPKAKYDGEIVKIEVVYKAELSEMTSSLAKVIRSVNKEDVARAKIASKSGNTTDFPSELKFSGDKLDGVNFEADTVMVNFYIRQDLDMSGGDKTVFGSSLKTVVTSVIDDSIEVEDDSIQVDGLMSMSSISNRIVLSPLIVGIGNRVMEKIEDDILDIYFK